MYAHPDQGSTGDAEAFAAVYERYRAHLVAYCRRRLANGADAEDVAHEAMLRAYRAFGSFDARADPWPWLVTIAGRLCTDMRRRQLRQPDKPAELLDHDVHEEAVGRLRAGIVEEALDRLPPRYRTTLVLHEFAGWTYDEIAQLQGKSVASVRSVLSRGRRRLTVGIESVARSRHQWPLPGAVPDLARRLRAYARTARDALLRPLQAVLSLVDPSAVLMAIVLGTHATVVGASVLVPGPAPPTTDGGAATRPPPAATVGAAVEASAALPLGTAATDGTAAAELRVPSWLPPETVARVDSRSAPLPSDAPATPMAEVVVEAHQESLWLRAFVTWRAPSFGVITPGTQSNVPCQWLLMGPQCAEFRQAVHR